MVSMHVGSRKGGGLTQVGAKGYFMANSHVGHDCRVGEGRHFCQFGGAGRHVEIGDGVIFGGLAAVQQILPGRQGRDDRRPDRRQSRRDPLCHGVRRSCRTGGLNLIGLKRRGLSATPSMRCARPFRAVFYGEGGSLADRASAAKDKYAGVIEVGEIVDFILADAKQELCLARRRGGDAA